LQALSLDKLAALNLNALVGLRTAAIAALSSDQLPQLGTAGDGVSHLDLLTTQQVLPCRWLPCPASVAQVQALTTAQAAALNSAQIGVLSTRDVAAGNG
jgi:hypothetical protein